MKQDLQYALRLMRRRPGSTAAAVLVIALGIGADTAMFSVVNKVLLEPLPYPQPDRLVYLRSDSPMGRAMMSSVPKYLIWRQGKVAFEHVAAFTSVEPVALDDDGGRQLIPRISVSADYFPVFGLRLALGRAFTAAEDVPRGPRVAVISHGLWQRRFGRDPSVVGRSIRLANESVEVVGVTARDAPVDSRIDAWTPLRADDNSADHSSWLQVVARLRPGVTLREAHRQIYGLAGEYHRRYPNSLGPLETFGLTPLRDVVVGEARAAAMFLFGAVTFVLLIACANVANLMLAQTTERQRELSTRAALGARPSRIIGQLLTESVLLSLTGGAIGVALAAAGLQLVTTVGGSYVPLIGSTHVTLDWRVLQFSIALTLLTPLVFGLYPALRASRLDLARQLGSSAGEAGGPAAHARLRGALVVMQMAGALVLLAGAGLLIRSFVSTRTVEPGFVSHNVLTLEMPVSSPRFARTANLAAFVRTAEQRVQVLPDVSVMAAASSLPLEAGASFPFVIDRRPLLRSPFHGTAHWRRVSSGYFDVFGIRPLSGRLFTRHDTAEGLPVAIISHLMARRFWPGNAALGERIRIGRESGVGAVEPARTVVGVVSDVRDTGLNRDPEPMVYVPLAQLTDRLNAFENQSHPLKWVIRTTAAPLRLSDAIERELRASGDNVVVGAVRTMDEVVARSTAQSDFNTLVLTLFAGVSVSLAALGLYGLMSYTIAQRTREIAVRMALGASAWRARRMIFEEAFRLTAGGVVIGAVASLTLARYMDSSIFGIAAWDPTVLGGVTAFLIGVAVITTLLSARRVTTVRAIDALKHI